MKEYRTAQDIGHDIPAILYECREIMTDHLMQSLSIVMDEVDDVLLDIAIKTTNSEERTKYFHAMHDMRLKRHNIERVFIEKFSTLFIEKIRQDDGP